MMPLLVLFGDSAMFGTQLVATCNAGGSGAWVLSAKKADNSAAPATEVQITAAITAVATPAPVTTLVDTDAELGAFCLKGG